MIRILKTSLVGSHMVLMVAAILSTAFFYVSCEQKELDIQQNFPFEIEVMPVPKELAKDETIEIRIAIKREGVYSNTKYFLRYFQFDGQGSLRYYNEPPYMPNDSYQLATTQFRLYYTSQSSVSQLFEVWISDNFGNEKQLSFQFNSKD